MRHLLLLAVLASACDQGANAAPTPQPLQQEVIQVAPPPPKYEPYVIRDDADLVVKARVVIDEMVTLFEQANQDCGLLATNIEQFVDRNLTRFSVLTAYTKAHPNTDKMLQDAFKPQMDRLVKTMTPTLTNCMQGEHMQRMTKAFEKLSESAQLQRPR